jgi:hypothetical protein
MPQLDIYTYFTQFQWFLLIFIILFLFINNQFIPTFQSLFIIRSYIKKEVQGKEKDRLGFDFDFAIEKKTFISASPQSYISQWEKIYERAQTLNSKKSNKLNDKNIKNPAR